MSRLNILDFIKLSPEEITTLEMQKLTKKLLTQGQKYFHLAYHSSSFTINQSPYCKSNQDAQIMSEKINDYIQFFIEIGGKVSFQEDNHDILNMNPQGNIITIK